MPWAEHLPRGTWRAVWRNTAGDQRSKSGFTSKAAATRYAGLQETRTRRGEQINDGRVPTWGSWCPIWEASRSVEPSTLDSERYRIDRYLTPQWGRHRLNRISRTEVQAWVTDLTKSGLAPASVEKVFRLFQASMTAALLDESVPVVSNPCHGVKLPTIAPGLERFLTRAEVDRIAYHLNQPYRLAVLLAAGSGMRWGELTGLHWQRVDLDTGLIDIVETWDGTARRIKTYPKGKHRRAVPVPGWLAEALDEAFARIPAGAGSCGQVHAPGGAKCRSPLVVTADRGGPLNGKNFGRRQWTDACLLAGIDPPRLHDLRHTYASWLVQAGVPLQEVQRLLGHASIVTTGRYAHLGTSQNDRVLAALD